jgi:hypothetical protein
MMTGEINKTNAFHAMPTRIETFVARATEATRHAKKVLTRDAQTGASWGSFLGLVPSAFAAAVPAAPAGLLAGIGARLFVPQKTAIDIANQAFSIVGTPPYKVAMTVSKAIGGAAGIGFGLERLALEGGLNSFGFAWDKGWSVAGAGFHSLKEAGTSALSYLPQLPANKGIIEAIADGDIGKSKIV